MTVQSATSPTLTDKKRCSGCGRCVAACSEKLYSLETFGYRKFSANTTPEKCIRCARCIKECPLGLLTDGSMTL